MEEIKMKCPICQEPVKKSKDLPDESKIKSSNCFNEFYIHWHNILYRIKNPKTPWSNG